MYVSCRHFSSFPRSDTIYLYYRSKFKFDFDQYRTIILSLNQSKPKVDERIWCTLSDSGITSSPFFSKFNVQKIQIQNILQYVLILILY